MKTAAAYIRVSDERQDEYSPDSQLKLIKEFAKKNGYFVPDEYVFYDDGISAKTAKKRPEFNRMIALAKEKNNPFEAILVWKFSRFARNQEESIVYKNILRKKGVRVISISEPIIDSPFGDLIERIIEWMDEYYSINLSAEVKRGMLEKVSRGEPVCLPAIGYDLIDKRYVPNEQAVFVQQIFQDYMNGLPMRQIAIKYNSLGLTTRTGTPLESRTIQYMLYNPLYIGKIRYSTGEKTFAKSRQFDDPGILIVDGLHEPIIDMDTWNAVQEKLKKQKQMFGRYQRNGQTFEWMLKGLLRCGNCGATLVKSRDVYVQCHKYVKGRDCKVSHSISIKKADEIVIQALQDCVRNCSFNIEPAERVDTSVINYAELIRKEEVKLARAKDAYLAGIDTVDEYKANKAEITKAIKSLEKQRDEATKETIDLTAYSKKVEDVLKIVTNPEESTEAKNYALRSILTKVLFNKSSNTFSLFFYY